jgi:hypothetical protein
LDHPETLLERSFAVTNLSDFGRLQPYSLPCYLYYRSLLLQPGTEKWQLNLAVAMALSVAGLKIAFQNMFITHDLYRTAKKELDSFTISRRGPLIARILENTDRIAKTIQELECDSRSSFGVRLKKKLRFLWHQYF